MRRFVRFFALISIVTLALAVVPAVAPSTALARGGQDEANHIDIKDFAFSPASLTIRVGDTVTWENYDSAPHTVTATDPAGSFDSGTLQNKQEFSYTFTKAGKFEYHCAIHPMMTGTITVTEDGSATASMTNMMVAQPAQMDMTGTVTTTSAAAAEPNHVNIQNFAFNPQVLTVTVGSTVTWTNLDSVGHTATSTDSAEPFGSGTLLTGQSYSYTFNKAGKFDYICEVHPFMTGTIVVVAGGAAPGSPTPGA